MDSRIYGRVTLTILVLGEAAVLYLTASSLASHGMLYGCAQLCGTPQQHIVALIAAVFGIATFILPIAIGACCHTWQGAIALVAVAWVAAVIGHAGTLLAPTISLASTSGPYGGLFGSPLWLDPNHTITLVLSLALILILGWLGWVARQTWQASRAADH